MYIHAQSKNAKLEYTYRGIYNAILHHLTTGIPQLECTKYRIEENI